MISQIAIQSKKVALAIAHAIARPKPAKPGNRHSISLTAVNGMIAATLLVLFVTKFGAFFSDYLSRTFHYRPDVALPKSKWKVLLEDECGLKCRNLWASDMTLQSPNFYALASERKQKKFWVGVSIDDAERQEALSKKALHIFLGRLNAPFRILVNERERASGNGCDSLPISLPLGTDDFNSQLRIAIEINHSLGSSYPIAINYPNEDAGIYTHDGIGDVREFYLFISTISALGLGISALIAAILFFFLWLNVRQRKEFFAFSAFSLCLFSVQLLAWSKVSGSMPRQFFYEAALTYRILEGILAAFLGFSYARIRTWPFMLICLGGLVMFFAMEIRAINSSSFMETSIFAGKVFTPLCFFAGAFACFSQSLIGKNVGFSGMSQDKQKHRSSRLEQFSILLVALGTLYAIESFRLGGFSGFTAYWQRPIQFTLLLMVAGFLLRDYRDFDFLLEKAHLSKFHKPTGGAPKPIYGMLLEVDMKGSSKYYEDDARLANGKELPTLWNEAAIQIAASHGGEILATEGDAFRAFFEKPIDPNSVYRVVEEIEKFGKNLSENSIFFRATCISGAILPVYKELNGRLLEDYEHAPGSACFKEASRYLREEKRLSGGIWRSTLVVEKALAVNSPPPAHWKSLQTEKLSVPDVGDRELTFYSISG